MKKIFSYAMMLLASAFVFTSCEDDNNSNPTLVNPTSFTINNPSVGEGVVDLLLSKSVDLTWSQPKYTEPNAPTIVTYTVQVGTANTFKTEYDINLSPEENKAAGADYASLLETYTTCSVDFPTADVAKALMQINQWTEEEVPAVTNVYVRVKAAVQNATKQEFGTIYSNVVSFKAAPYYIELADAPIVMWYLVGNHFGGKWGSDIGATALPMFVKPDFSYDKVTGTGEITYVNYFITGDYEGNECGTAGFKIQPATFNWDLGLTGDNAKKGVIIYRNKGDDGGHIVAPADGYYIITVNTANPSGKMEPYEGPVPFTGKVCLSGSFNDWSDTEMLPYNSEGLENHAWYYVAEFAGDTEFKFKEAGSWDTNWGGVATNTSIYYGTTTGNGSNLTLPAGKYVISFNDITGEFSIAVL